MPSLPQPLPRGLTVLKLGGAPLDELPSRGAFAAAVAARPPGSTVVVHGGGPLISAYQERLGLETRKVAGLRVTDDAGLELAQMLLSGLCNERLTAALLAAGVDACGLSGVDRGLLRCRRRQADGQDLGWVGEVASMRREVLDQLLAAGVTPVVSPISLGEADGHPYNVNADEAAAAVAVGLGAAELAFVADVAGVRLADGSLASRLDPQEALALIADGTVHGGMVPKLRAALDALAQGIPAVRIVDVAGLAEGGGTLLLATLRERLQEADGSCGPPGMGAIGETGQSGDREDSEGARSLSGPGEGHAGPSIAGLSIQPLRSPVDPDWLRLRQDLWPDDDEAEHLAEMADFLAQPERYAQFIARTAQGEGLGLAEAALRTDYVNGTSSSPVVFLEGLYVVPKARCQGVARALVQAVAAWGREQGCSELASDALLHNQVSHAVHRRLGFAETERVVSFCRAIGG